MIAVWNFLRDFLWEFMREFRGTFCGKNLGVAASYNVIFCQSEGGEYIRETN